MTSTKVHEEAYSGWAANHLRVILASLNEVLREIYVVPAQRAARRKAILGLKDELMPTPKSGKATEEDPGDGHAAGLELDHEEDEVPRETRQREHLCVSNSQFSRCIQD